MTLDEMSYEVSEDLHQIGVDMALLAMQRMKAAGGSSRTLDLVLVLAVAQGVATAYLAKQCELTEEEALFIVDRAAKAIVPSEIKAFNG